MRPIPALKQIIQLYHFIYLFLFHKSYIFLIFFQFFFQNRSPAVDNDWSFFRPDVVDDNIPEFQQRVNIFRNTTVRPGCEVKLGHPFFLVSLKCRYILNPLYIYKYIRDAYNIYPIVHWCSNSNTQGWLVWLETIKTMSTNLQTFKRNTFKIQHSMFKSGQKLVILPFPRRVF